MHASLFYLLVETHSIHVEKDGQPDLAANF